MLLNCDSPTASLAVICRNSLFPFFFFLTAEGKKAVASGSVCGGMLVLDGFRLICKYVWCVLCVSNRHRRPNSFFAEEGERRGRGREKGWVRDETREIEIIFERSSEMFFHRFGCVRYVIVLY